jgi:hypothetical protein
LMELLRWTPTDAQRTEMLGTPHSTATAPTSSPRNRTPIRYPRIAPGDAAMYQEAVAGLLRTATQRDPFQTSTAG